jgi:hypothetical protein
VFGSWHIVDVQYIFIESVNSTSRLRLLPRKLSKGCPPGRGEVISEGMGGRMVGESVISRGFW